MNRQTKKAGVGEQSDCLRGIRATLHIGRMRVILMTGYATVDTAIAALGHRVYERVEGRGGRMTGNGDKGKGGISRYPMREFE